MITRVIASSSAAPEYLNGMRCLAMSEKYSLASRAVLVPKPGGGTKITHQVKTKQYKGLKQNILTATSHNNNNNNNNM